MSDFSERITNLSPEKRALLTLQLKKRAQAKSSRQVIPKRDESKPLALSFAQHQLWFLDQLEPGNPIYNIATAVRFSGPMNLCAMERSFNEILRRHEALRTTFKAADGLPFQVISPNSALKLPVEDLQSLPEASREDAAIRLATEEARSSFDLTKGPLVGVKLLKLAEQEHALLLTMHHIVSDGWSIAILMNELKALYEAFSEGKPAPPPKLPVQYADFAQWQREHLRGEYLDEQLSYWKRQLADAPFAIDLQTDRPRPLRQTYHGSRQSMVLSKTLTGELERLGRNYGATLYMTLLAAFKVLLYRYTDQQDILVGTPVGGRSQPEVQGLIGFFANTLVFRTKPSGRLTFIEFLQQVRETALSGYAHQELPFELLVEHLQPERDMSRNPIFQVMFTLQNAPVAEMELSGLKMSPLQIENTTSKFDLRLSVTETHRGVIAALEYNTDLFESETARRMLMHFDAMLKSIVSNPQLRLSQLEYLSQAERHQMLTASNNKRQEFPCDQQIHTLFQRQAERSLDAVAVEFEGELLSYRQLNARANQLAHYLRMRGVGPDVLVGVCMDRCLEMIVGLLAVLKAGGAYVPLDPNYPEERLAFMLEDAQAQVLLMREFPIEELHSSRVNLVCLERDWNEIAQQSQENPTNLVTGDNLAYVIYTSGSTGKPKGVCITHSNVSRLLEATRRWFDFDSNDIWTLFHSFAFDFSVWEMWGALAYGGRLVVVPYWVTRSPAAFLDLIRQQGVTVLNQTPSAFRNLMEASLASGSDELALRVVIFGGEALDPSMLKPWVEGQASRGVRLVNMYGITETTVHVTYRRIEEEEVREGIGSVIGVPIADLEVYVLDESYNPVPVGVRGDIYVGGGGLGRGYLNRAEMTAERFVPNPYSERGGERLYKTGDQGRYLASGELEYQGRKDEQVKIRGFRIELGEIESALCEHPQIKASVVVATQSLADDKYLTAYLVPLQQDGVTISEIRDHLKQILPEHMIPSAFVILNRNL